MWEEADIIYSDQEEKKLDPMYRSLINAIMNPNSSKDFSHENLNNPDNLTAICTAICTDLTNILYTDPYKGILSSDEDAKVRVFLTHLIDTHRHNIDPTIIKLYDTFNYNTTAA